ncbi:protein rep [Clostridioides difficile]|uniref:protein rep n=1 Tax=Clostridioides difficile TaxID=1496 RepID=UPI0022388EB7|nr:protein rep [Clostridioides difficile]MCC8848541.1 protein rep [Clostridioides difficile]MCZ1131623.1 protein rep [Clostridioides difficile]MDI2816137.1 protein rep [Clostridioides difficile]MDI3035577.1 protein rep [Clostridioides difficile]MDI6347109.1 protein rep [Clostridioides difficile]
MWLLDSYKNQKVKDFKKTNLCKDKFCNNCKKVIQASRMSNYIPYIEFYNDIYSLYHVVLTVPNCSGEQLQSVIKNMFKSYRYLTQYFQLNKKIKGIDFGIFGYSGSIRSLEITFKDDVYHPHLHCIFALDKNYFLDKKYKNSYSYSYNEFKRNFSFLEILVQKVWYLLNNNIRVNLKNIDSISEGYSCTFDSINDSTYYEVFKYMTKSTDENSSLLTYENFKVLFFSLYRVRQIQGYGIFYNFKDDDNLDFEVDEYYKFVIDYLQKKESPVEVFEAPEDSLKDDFLLISRKKIYSYLKNL